MKEQSRRIRRELTGAPVSIGETTVTPVVGVDGRVGGDAAPRATWEWGGVRLAPRAAVIRDAEGRETTVAITNLHESITRNMTLAGAAIAVASLAAMLARKLVR